MNQPPPLTPPVSPYPQKPSGRGCLFWAAIVAAVMLLMVIIGGYVGYRFASKLARTLVNEYTETNAVALPTVRLSDEEISRLTNRIDRFEKAVQENKAIEPLVLTEEELNGLITRGMNTNSPGGFYVTLDEDRIKAQLSIPAENFGFRMLKGRYLNGSGEFLVSMRDGVLRVNVKDLSVKGKPLPEEFMRSIRQENFAAGWTNDPNFNEAAKKLQEVKVEHGKIRVVPKPLEAKPAAMPEAPEPVKRR
jgi:hypothetical protein